MSLSANPISTGAPTLAWAQAVKRLELAGLGPAEPLADALLEIERQREQLVNGAHMADQTNYDPRIWDFVRLYQSRR